MAETTDSGLVRRLRARKPAAWDEVYRLYGERVFAFAYELSGNSDDAFDLAQQTFVRALPRLDKLRPAEVDLAEYLLATTQELFHGKRARSSEESPEPESQAPPSFAAYELFQRTSDALAWSGYWQRPRRLAGTTAVATVTAGLALIGALGAGSAYLVSRSSEPRLFVGATAPVAPSVAGPPATTDAPVAAPKRVKRRARKKATTTAATTTTIDTDVATTTSTPVAPRPAARPHRRPPKRPPVVVAPPTTGTTTTTATTDTTQTDTQTTATETSPPPPPPPTEPPPPPTEPAVP